MLVLQVLRKLGHVSQLHLECEIAANRLLGSWCHRESDFTALTHYHKLFHPSHPGAQTSGTDHLQ